jgi:hypothetical protein
VSTVLQNMIDDGLDVEEEFLGSAGRAYMLGTPYQLEAYLAR